MRTLNSSEQTYSPSKSHSGHILAVCSLNKGNSHIYFTFPQTYFLGNTTSLKTQMSHTKRNLSADLPEEVWGQDYPKTNPQNPSLVPRLSWNANIYRAENLVSFVRKHDVIKIGQKQKGNVCALFNQLCFNTRCVCYSTPDS